MLALTLRPSPAKVPFGIGRSSSLRLRSAARSSSVLRLPGGALPKAVG